MRVNDFPRPVAFDATGTIFSGSVMVLVSSGSTACITSSRLVRCRSAQNPPVMLTPGAGSGRRRVRAPGDGETTLVFI